MVHVLQPQISQDEILHLSCQSSQFPSFVSYITCTCTSSLSVPWRNKKIPEFLHYFPMSSSDPSGALYTTLITHSMEQARLLGTIISTWILMLAIVALRFVARRLAKSFLWYDDWLILPATVRQFFGPLSHHAY